MKIRLLLLWSLLTFTVSCFAGSEGLKQGMSFQQARKFLQQRGWTPIDVHKDDGYEFFGVEKILKESKINEVDSCAMDRALCNMFYKKGNECLRLITHGEILKDMKVDSWTNECPE